MDEWFTILSVPAAALTQPKPHFDLLLSQWSDLSIFEFIYLLFSVLTEDDDHVDDADDDYDRGGADDEMQNMVKLLQFMIDMLADRHWQSKVVEKVMR